MSARKNPPLLRLRGITRTPVILTRYKRRDDGLIRADEQWDVPVKDLLTLIDELGVSDAALDEIARALGMERERGRT